MADTIYIRAGDTEPLPITVSASGLSNLDDVNTATFYAREKSATTNHVDGASMTVSDSANLEVTFDPASNKNGGGDAFDATGTYLCYVLLAFADGDETRHPGQGWLKVVVAENYE